MDPQEITSIPSTSGSQDLPAGSAITRKRRKSFSEKVGDMTPMDNPVVSSVNTKELKIDSTKAEKPTLGREKSELKRKAWTSDLINYFFDALKMYGKDFDKITKYIRQKTKKAEYLKNYEQVRNLYYNTAKVLTQNLKLSEDPSPELSEVSREIREIFLLVNVGEWRRKLGVMNVTFAIEKFRELVFTGSTRVLKRHKKLVKIKTPVCPALKKFFGATLDESQTLPTDISLQIVPSRHRDESYVSYLRQNPLLRANFSPSVPIRELLSFLHRKWSIPEVTDDVNPSQSPLYFYFGNRKLTSMQIVPGNTQQRVQNLISLERFIRTLTKPSEGQIPEPTESISCQAAGVDVEIAVVTKLETAGTDFLPVDPTEASVTETSSSLSPTVYKFSAEAFDNGLSLVNCPPLLTVGHLYLMYKKPDVLVLEYRIRDELTESRIANGAWNCLVTLLRSEYLDLLQKRVPVTSLPTPVVIQIPTTTTSANNVPVEPVGLPVTKPNGTKTVSKRRPNMKPTPSVPEVKPAGGSASKRRQMNSIDSDRSPNFSMANEHLAFMDQLGQLSSRKGSKKVIARSFASDINFAVG